MGNTKRIEFPIRSAVDHRRYIQTHHWRLRKQKFFKTYQKICIVCQTRANIHLHHIRYDNLWHESDRDLVPMCGEHHNELHNTMGVSVEDISIKYFTTKLGVGWKQRKRKVKRGTI